jgi:hypothetical protein
MQEKNRSMKAADKSFENVENFKYFGSTMTNKSTMPGETESRLNLGNALLLFYPESVFPFATETHKHENIFLYYIYRVFLIINFISIQQMHYTFFQYFLPLHMFRHNTQCTIGRKRTQKEDKIKCDRTIRIHSQLSTHL